MQINWKEQIDSVRKYIEHEPSLFAFCVRDWEITEQAGLRDLAWALARDDSYATANDAKGLLEMLEAHWRKNMANNLGQPTIQEVSNVMCGQCNAVICLGCPVYELDKQARAQQNVQQIGGESAEQTRIENELSDWGNPSRSPTRA